jgi:hypothetical protein
MRPASWSGSGRQTPPGRPGRSHCADAIPTMVEQEPARVRVVGEGEGHARRAHPPEQRLDISAHRHPQHDGRRIGVRWLPVCGAEHGFVTTDAADGQRLLRGDARRTIRSPCRRDGVAAWPNVERKLTPRRAGQRRLESQRT